MGLFSDAINRFRDAAWNWLSEGRSTMLLTQDEKKKQVLIVLARRYYDGDHDVKLTERQKEWLEQHGKTAKFAVNHGTLVVNTVVERLKVIGFEVAGEKEGDENALSKVAWKWWDANRMDALQTEAHRKAERDGEAFILVDWDVAAGRPIDELHQRFVDESAGGDDYGMWVEYPNDDFLQKPLMAVKQWKEKDADGKVSFRRTVYYPERIERFIRQDGQWAPFKKNEGDIWPTPWVTASGAPLGIPVMHFRTPNAQSALKEVIPLQDAHNKTWLDLLASADTSVFRNLFFWGVVPTTDGKDPKDDGSNLLKFKPGQVFSNKADPAKVRLDVVEPSGLASLLEMEDRIVVRIASVSSTPLSRFISSRQIAAEGTLKQQEAPLLGKVAERQTLYGNAWEDMVRMGARLANTFGGAAYDVDAQINTIWANAELRDETATLQQLEAKKRLRVTDKQIWVELGYNAEQIGDFQAELDRERAAMLLAAARAAQTALDQAANSNGNGAANKPGVADAIPAAA